MTSAQEPYNDPTGIRILINKSWGPCEEGTIEWEISHDGCHLTNVTVGDRRLYLSLLTVHRLFRLPGHGSGPVPPDVPRLGDAYGRIQGWHSYLPGAQFQCSNQVLDLSLPYLLRGQDTAQEDTFDHNHGAYV